MVDFYIFLIDRLFAFVSSASQSSFMIPNFFQMRNTMSCFKKNCFI